MWTGNCLVADNVRSDADYLQHRDGPPRDQGLLIVSAVVEARLRFGDRSVDFAGCWS